MEAQLLLKTLGWSALINMALLLYWFLVVAFARDWVYRWHSKWFPLSRERFNEIHYQGMLILKVLLFFFNIVPYLALRLVL